MFGFDDLLVGSGKGRKEIRTGLGLEQGSEGKGRGKKAKPDKFRNVPLRLIAIKQGTVQGSVCYSPLLN